MSNRQNSVIKKRANKSEDSIDDVDSDSDDNSDTDSDSNSQKPEAKKKEECRSAAEANGHSFEDTLED